MAWRDRISRRTVFLVILAVALAAGAFVFLRGRIDLSGFTRWAEGLPDAGFLLVLALLPIFAFPVSLLYVVTGAKYGAWGGLAAVAGTTLFQLAVCHFLARRLRGPIERLAQRFDWKLPVVPEGGAWALTLLGQLLPGIPYAAKNYLLPLSGVPLGTFILVSLPVNLVHASLALLAGHWSDGFTPGRIVFLVLYGLTIGIAAHVTLKKLRREKAASRAEPAPPPAGSDPTPRA